VFASCLRPDIEYKTLGVSLNTTAKELIWQLLAKYKMRHRDPKLFYLTMEVGVHKTGGSGVTRRTIIVEDESRPAELKNCNPWGECKFTLQMRKGGLVRIYDRVLMEESNYKSLLISEETTVEDVVKILLHCYGLERLERVDRFDMYEQCSKQRYQRKLNNEDKPLAVQNQWPGPGMFSFVLRRSMVSVEDRRSMVSVEDRRSMVSVEDRREDNHWVRPSNVKPDNELSWSLLGNNRTEGVDTSGYSSWTIQEESRNSNSANKVYESNKVYEANNLYEAKSVYSRVWSKDSDKGSEEAVSSDMDTSISSNDSPTPPSTQTPLSSVSSTSPPQSLSLSSISSISCTGALSADKGLPKPLPSFLFPSPAYASFSGPLTSTPYSSKPPSTPQSMSSLSSTSSSLSLSSFELTVVPMLPPKPTSLASLFARPASTSYADYENYFYI